MSNLKEIIKAKIDKIPDKDDALEQIRVLLDNRDQLARVVKSLQKPRERPVLLPPRDDKNAAYFRNKIDLTLLPNQETEDGYSIRQWVEQALENLENLEKSYDELLKAYHFSSG